MYRVILAIALSLSVAGCTLPTLESLKTAIHFGTASVANPVTPTRLNQMENGLKVVASGLNAWRRSCVQGLINADCKDQIRSVQVYTVQVKPALVRLRAFVRNNDQISAVSVFNDLTDLVGIIKSKAAAAGQPLPEN
jgi:hypothetical protein